MGERIDRLTRRFPVDDDPEELDYRALHDAAVSGKTGRQGEFLLPPVEEVAVENPDQITQGGTDNVEAARAMMRAGEPNISDRLRAQIDPRSTLGKT